MIVRFRSSKIIGMQEKRALKVKLARLADNVDANER